MSTTEYVPPTNDDRATWAKAAMDAFRHASGDEHLVDNEDEDVVSDLLADVMHWCDRNGQDFEVELERARMHYRDET